MSAKRVLSVTVFLLTLFACKSPPPPEPAPVPEPAKPAPSALSVLEFTGIEAASTARVSLRYTLNIENSGGEPFTAAIRGWTLTLNETTVTSDPVAEPAGAALFVRTVVDTPVPGAAIEVAAGGGVGMELRLELDLSRFPGWKAEELTDYDTKLALDIACTGRGGTAAADAVALVSFPRVREPEFTITRIAVLQAELINTRFKVAIRIDNPNFFPVELSSFEYELYGDGLLWADGAEKKVLQIPAGQSEEKDLFLTMNFIGMKRGLLDDVINMDYVSYRFAGDVRVDTGVAWLPTFRADFDKSGYSEVFK